MSPLAAALYRRHIPSCSSYSSSMARSYLSAPTVALYCTLRQSRRTGGCRTVAAHRRRCERTRRRPQDFIARSIREWTRRHRATADRARGGCPRAGSKPVDALASRVVVLVECRYTAQLLIKHAGEMSTHGIKASRRPCISRHRAGMLRLRSC
jgi:hypothetical protein